MTIVPKAVVDGGPLPISKFLEQEHHIPDYQRDFTWNQYRIRQLWGDLLALYNRNSNNDILNFNPGGYYLGAVVVIESNGAPDEVVDGQQRLTALTTLAAVILEEVRALPKKYQPAGLTLSLEKLVSAGMVSGEIAARLTFADSEMSDFYLQTSVVAQDRSQREKHWATAKASALLKRGRGKSPMALLKVAFEEHYAQLKAFLGSTKGASRAKRIELFSRISTECVVVLRIAAGSYSNAWTIFESLNHRGSPLSQADLIKNQLLKMSPAVSHPHIIQIWGKLKDVVEDIGGIDLPEAIYLSHLAKYPRITTAQLFEDVTSKLNSGLKALEYIDLTLQQSEVILILKRTRQAYWTGDTISMLDDIFEVLSAKLAIPMLVSAYESKGKSGTSASDFEQLVRACMNFTYRYMKLLEGDTATFAKAINEAALAISAGSTISNISAKLRTYAPDHAFKEAFKTYSVSRTKLAYFSIYWLERSLMSGSGSIPLPHGIQQNVEHIMPKTPNAQWPDAQYLKKSDQEAYNYLLWRIGNLIPLPGKINKSIKNNGIALKISEYSAVTLHSPRSLGPYINNGKWDEKSINDRQVDLASTAVKAWSLA